MDENPTWDVVYRGYRISIEHEDENVFYIQVAAPCGMFDYDGWWRPDFYHVAGFTDALDEAIRGAQIVGPPTEAQFKVLRHLEKQQGWTQIAGHGMAGHMSAARALKRRGLVIEGPTGSFGITNAGERWLNEQATV